MGIVAAFLKIAGSRGFMARIGAVFLAAWGSGLLGALLAIRVLARRERLRWLGSVALLVNSVPSIGFCIATIAHRQGLRAFSYPKTTKPALRRASSTIGAQERTRTSTVLPAST